MSPAHEAIHALIDKVANLDAGTAQFPRDIDGVIASLASSLESSAAFRALSKLTKDAPTALVDCAVVNGLAFCLQHRLKSVMQSTWRGGERGQARAHDYVDLWGRTTSNRALCAGLLIDAEAGMASSQLRARFEALIDGTTSNLLQSAQALMAAGEVEISARVSQYALQRLKTPQILELKGSILKELHQL